VTVVDASAVVDVLVPPDAARRDFLVEQLPGPADPWLAPDVLLFEVFAVVRRHVLRGVLSSDLAATALQRLRRLPVELIPTGGLIGAAWLLRDRFGAADSLYAAVAMSSGLPVLTTDLRFARAARDAGIETVVPGVSS
jgi:predicted nucleic acid-binding protein